MQLKKLGKTTRKQIKTKRKTQRNFKSNKKQNQHNTNKHIQYGSAVETDLNSSLLNYYYYSSHNSELITSQLAGICSICVINDFISDTSQTIGGCIELDLRNVKQDRISVDHYCKKAGLDFETVLKKLIEKYNSFTGIKYPLIISIDANGLTKPANTEEFGNLWSAILNRCFKDHSQLRPDFDITKDTQMSDIMGKILFRWDYSTAEKQKAKDLVFNENTTQHLTKINIVKNPLSKTIAVKSVKFNGNVLDGVNVKEKLIRLYPKTPIFSSAFNYNFTEYLLNGVQMAALNLNLNNKYALAYNEFFKYNKVIKIPDEIYSDETNIIKNSTQYVYEDGEKIIEKTNQEQIPTEDSSQVNKYCNSDINSLLSEALNTIDYDTAYKQVNDVISIIKEGCSDAEKGKLQNLTFTYNVPSSTISYDLSIVNDIIVLTESDSSSLRKQTQVGGVDIQRYRISVVTNNTNIIKYNNIFDSQNSNIYMHYPKPFDIFNVVYVKVSTNTDTYIGCLNMTPIDLSQAIRITLYKKETYLKSSNRLQTSKLHRSFSELSTAQTLTSGLASMIRRTSVPDISQTKKNNITANTQTNSEKCGILPLTIQVDFKFELITN